MAVKTLATASNQSVYPGLSGANMAIFIFVLSQFVEITFFKIGSFDVSLQKILAFIFYPIAIFVMRKVKFAPYLITFATIILFAYILPLLLAGNISDASSAIFVVMVGLLGSIVLYTALSFNPNQKLKLFANIWIFFGLSSAIITILQSFGWLPLFTVSENTFAFRDISTGLYRGVGLKTDPNFQALMLSLTIPFILNYIKRWEFSLASIAIVLAGTIATFSRMALLLSGIAILVWTIRKLRKKIIIRAVISATLLAFMLGALYLLILPQDIKDYISTRFIQIFDFFYALNSGISIRPNEWISSSTARAILLRAGVILGIENLPFGVGAFQTARVLFAFSGLENAVHNTFVELFLIGGLAGLASVFSYLLFIFKSNKIISSSKISSLQFVPLFNITILIAFLFLSLTYNSILWLPLVLSLSAISAVRANKK